MVGANGCVSRASSEVCPCNTLSAKREWVPSFLLAERRQRALPLLLLHTTTVALFSVQHLPFRRRLSLKFVPSVAWRVTIDSPLDLRIRYAAPSRKTRASQRPSVPSNLPLSAATIAQQRQTSIARCSTRPSLTNFKRTARFIIVSPATRPSRRAPRTTAAARERIYQIV